MPSCFAAAHWLLWLRSSAPWIMLFSRISTACCRKSRRSSRSSTSSSNLSFISYLLHPFALQRIAMNAELLRGGTLVAMVALECALDHALFQDLDGLLQEESTVEQVLHQLVKSVFHFLSSPPFGNLRIPF